MKNKKNSTASNQLVGRRVLCINDDFSNRPLTWRILFAFPLKGREYTIRGTFDKSYYLEEIRNPEVTWESGFKKEICFYKWRFRILEEKQHEDEDQKAERELTVLADQHAAVKPLTLFTDN